MSGSQGWSSSPTWFERFWNVLVTEIDPGHHIVTAGHDQHELNAQAGQTYYYEQTVCWAMYDPSNATGLQKVSASEGRGGVSQRKQAPNAF